MDTMSRSATATLSTSDPAWRSTRRGRALLLPKETSINIQELIEKSRALQNLFSASQVQGDGGFGPCQISSATPAINPLAASDLFVITISLAEALCGEEDVFGNLCEEACVTSTDRPFAVEGVTVRAVPLALQTPLPNLQGLPAHRPTPALARRIDIL